MTEWLLDPQFLFLQAFFGSLDSVFALKGELLGRSRLSETIRFEYLGINYYVKRYRKAGKGLRSWFGRPRIKAEWENLQHFAAWGLPTATVVAFGMENHLGRFVRGAMITMEIPQTIDLAVLAKRKDGRLRDRNWVKIISTQLAYYARTMHAKRFVHTDLKWRNILVDHKPQLFLIDCPAGGFLHGPLFKHRVVKDLACLDKVAKHKLSRTQRLRFYLQYVEREELLDSDKRRIRKILHYFEGRE